MEENNKQNQIDGEQAIETPEIEKEPVTENPESVNQDALAEEIALEQPTGNKKGKIGNVIFFTLAGLIIAILFTFIILNHYVFFKVNIVGSSMYPTLESGQILTANSCGEPERGDIVIIKNQKSDETLIIKRVIAVGGDYIEIRSNRKVYVNGQEIDEPYLRDQRSTDLLDGAYLLELEDLHGGMGRIPEGYLFYLGDNRENSADSRKYGLCKEEDVIGVIDGFANFFHKITSIFS